MSVSMSSRIRVGLIGAGYIADWHAGAIRATPGLQLTAVCDTSPVAGQRLAMALGVPAFDTVAGLIGSGLCDAVHILTPPATHEALTLQCLSAGLHCLVEKPAALSHAGLERMVAAADTAGRGLGVGHNFLGLPGYDRLKALKDSGRLGRIVAAQINWCLPLAPLRSGPFGVWLLRAPGNLLLELGPHLFAFATDLFGDIDVQHLALSRPVDLPGGGKRHQGWRILARAGGVEVTLNISLVETTDDRSVTLRGSGGLARFDYAADTLIVSRDNTADLILNPLRKELSQAWQHLRNGLRNGVVQSVSLNRKSAYARSFQGSIAGFYHGVRSGTPDPRFSGLSALRVSQAMDATLAFLPVDPVAASPTFAPDPKVMVIGGTGFIGRALTRTLVARGHDVRVVSRGDHGPFADIADHVETVGLDLTDAAALQTAMTGMDVVFNLARSAETTWDAALENEVGTALRIADAALGAGVRRLIYTGTIASYDMSDPRVTITEATGFGDLTRRNLYARSKAECEARLLDRHRDAHLPLVIARPGIVLGPGGPLQHWGIGRWHGPGAVRLWGDGRNILPFVLAGDVADALVRMMDIPGIEGQSFNLTGTPLHTARDYFAAIHARLGARTRLTTGNPALLWLAGGVKYRLKRHILRRPDAGRPSLTDWKSRAHLARFDNSQARTVLGWEPQADPAVFLDRAVSDTGLFGF